MSLKQGQASGHLALRICSWRTLPSLEGGLVTLVPESGEDTVGRCGEHTAQEGACLSSARAQPSSPSHHRKPAEESAQPPPEAARGACLQLGTVAAAPGLLRASDLLGSGTRNNTAPCPRVLLSGSLQG